MNIPTGVFAMNMLVGKRAVYSRMDREWSDEKRTYIEKGRTMYRGTIAALTTMGESNYPAIVMLYDDGTLQAHGIDTITVEAEPSGYRDLPATIRAPSVRGVAECNAEDCIGRCHRCG